MHRDELNKLTVNFNNFLANRASVDESLGAIPVEPTAPTTPVAESTVNLTPAHKEAIIEAVLQWWDMRDEMGFHSGGDQAFFDAGEEMLQTLAQILSYKPGMKEEAKPKKSGTMSKKEIDAYKADHETGKKDKDGKPIYNQNWKKK